MKVHKHVILLLWFTVYHLYSLPAFTQHKMKNLNVNDQAVDSAIVTQIEKTYGVKFLPGNYWYDKNTGAFGIQGGPCTGIGIPGLLIGGTLSATASGGGTGVFINGRELHPVDVLGFQAFMQVIPGRYWMDAYGNFGYEHYPAVAGNVYLLYKATFFGNKKNSHHKNNVWSGEKTSFGSDGTFMYYSSKKSDGTTYDYAN